MSIFTNSPDTPGQLRNETDKLFLKFEKTGVNTGSVSWNIPEPMEGCPSSGAGVYNGVIITVGTSPAEPSDSPVNEFIYRADSSVDFDLHSGDKINSQLVVAALYDNKTTTSITLTDLQPNTPYYVQAYPVDIQFRYSKSPARAYSQDTTTQLSPDVQAIQLVGLKLTPESDFGVNPTDGTNLTPGVTYTFEIVVNGITQTISINGSDAGTYEDLTNALNVELSKLENPYRSPFAPNTGLINVDVDIEIVTSWNGSAAVVQDSIFSLTDPSIVVINTVWFDTSTNTLNTWNGSAWVPSSYITSSTDPTSPDCGKYWFNGTQAYSWSGNAWCEVRTFVQVPDPRSANIPICGSFWYDTSRSILFRWNSSLLVWQPASAIYWNTNPSNTLTGDHWFDETNSKLFKWDGLVWVEQTPLIISSTTPVTPAPSAYWYNPLTEVLKQRNLLNTSWLSRTVLSWTSDPRDRVSCDLWWDSTIDTLNVYDTSNNTWNLVSSFQQLPVDPQTCPDVPVGSIWYNPTTKVSNIWDGVVWKVLSPTTEIIVFPTNPRTPVNGTAWFNGANWYTRASPNWNPLQVTTLPINPSMIPTGMFWYDETNNLLFQRNGLSWMPVMFSNNDLNPVLGTLWFDTNTNTLKRWERVRGNDQWVEIGPIASSSINQQGNLEIKTRDSGCENSILINRETDTLFAALGAQIGYSIQGADGLTNTPSFYQTDVGTDGTNAARKALIDTIKMQFGYPVVDVELTPAQINLGINNALSVLRKRSSLPYLRTFFFLDVFQGQQKYQLTNKCVGYNKIVDIMGLNRITSAFLSSAHGAGIYGQVILQQLYNFGTFDLLSYELMGQYIDNLEIMFATRLMYTWHENNRVLHITNQFNYQERVLVDAVIERTEQELMSDRFAGTWIQKYALAECMEMLSQVRGKYGTLPGAGGGINLNSADLSSHASEMKLDLLQQIEDYLVDSPGDIGLNSTLVFG